MVSLIISFLSAFGFRVRGGLDIPFTNKNFPLNKFWWAFIFAGCAKYLYQGDWNLYWVVFLATLISTQVYGWGEYCGCALSGNKPTERSDCDLVDDIVDNLKISCKGKVYKLTDYPYLFGVVGLSLRGLIISFLIGLSLNNIPFMIYGLAMGFIYYLCGLFSRKVIPLEKDGWCCAEWCFGYYIGLMLCVTC